MKILTEKKYNFNKHSRLKVNRVNKYQGMGLRRAGLGSFGSIYLPEKSILNKKIKRKTQRKIRKKKRKKRKVGRKEGRKRKKKKKKKKGIQNSIIQ